MNYEDQQMGSVVVPTRTGSRESIRSDAMAEGGTAGRKGLLSRTDSGNKPRLSVSIPGVGMGEERGNNMVSMSNGEERVKDEPEGMEEDLDEDDVSTSPAFRQYLYLPSILELIVPTLLIFKHESNPSEQQMLLISFPPPPPSSTT